MKEWLAAPATYIATDEGARRHETPAAAQNGLLKFTDARDPNGGGLYVGADQGGLQYAEVGEDIGQFGFRQFTPARRAAEVDRAACAQSDGAIAKHDAAAPRVDIDASHYRSTRGRAAPCATPCRQPSPGTKPR